MSEQNGIGSSWENPKDNSLVNKMSFGELYVGFVKLAFYRLARAIFNTIRALWWLVRGVALEEWRSSKPEYYDVSAHVYDIVYRYKFDLILGQASFEDFVLTHDRFVHPIYLLRDECVLYQVTPTHAVFVQVKDGVDVWRGTYGAFLRQAQFLLADKVITLPLGSLDRLAEQLGPNDAALVFVQNTARCGSTLLVRMFEETGRCVTFSEPDAVNGICKLAMARRAWDQRGGIRIVRALVRVLCKPVSRMKEAPLAYVVKMTAPSMEAAPFLVKAFPEAYHLFMYRDCIKMSRSLAVAAEVMPTLKLAHLLGSISPKGLQFAVSQMGCSNTAYTLTLPGHPYDAGIVLYGITVGTYLRMVDSGLPIAGVRYEDLTADADFFIRSILEYCHLPSSLGGAALRATGSDAQENSALSISNLKTKNKNYTMTQAVADFMERYLRENGIPTEPNPVLPKTITHRRQSENTEDKGGDVTEEARREEGTKTRNEEDKPRRRSAPRASNPSTESLASPTDGARNVKLITTLTTKRETNNVVIATKTTPPPKSTGMTTEGDSRMHPETNRSTAV